MGVASINPTRPVPSNDDDDHESGGGGGGGGGGGNRTRPAPWTGIPCRGFLGGIFPTEVPRGPAVSATAVNTHSTEAYCHAEDHPSRCLHHSAQHRRSYYIPVRVHVNECARMGVEVCARASLRPSACTLVS